MRTVSVERLEAARKELDRQGYCVLENVLSPEETTQVRNDLAAASAEDRRAGDAFLEYDGANQRVAMLLNRGRSFVDLAQHEVGLALIEHLLGEGFLLSSITANITGPGGEAMNLHADQGAVPRPWHFPTVANIMWIVDDFTADNGGTLVVPGSHKWPDFNEKTQADKAVPVVAPAGSLMCFEGRLIHGTGANVTENELRHGILAFYCLAWCRPQENVFLSLNPDVLAGASPRLLELLGYKMAGTLPLGMVNGRPWTGHPLLADAASGLALGEKLDAPDTFGRPDGDTGSHG
jgi:ectoine hydroxylase-related dioxygenase (phytanoyl-CoA dioxygenase family)